MIIRMPTAPLVILSIGELTMKILCASIRALLFTAVLAAPLMLNTVEAGERKVTRQGDRGHSVQRDMLRNRDSGTVTIHTTRTGTNGKVSTRDSVSVVDKEAGTWSRDATTTGPNGKTGAVTVEGARTDDGYTRSATRTGPNGKTSTNVTTRSMPPAP
jgi:hypothetical protein